MKDKLLQPKLDGWRPTSVRILYGTVGLVIGFLSYHQVVGPMEVTKWKDKIVFRESETSKNELKEEWTYKPDGTRVVSRYHLKTAASEGSSEQETEFEEIKKPPQYAVTAGYSFLGEPVYSVDAAARIGESPFWTVVGVSTPQNAFKVQDTVFTLGVRYEF